METEVIEFLAKKMSFPQEEITKDTVLNGMGATSLMLLSMVTDMEEHFGIHFSDRELGSFVTVGDVVRAVEEKIKH